jgi:hypothetical protein
MMLALPHFCFKSFNAFAQAIFYFGKTQSKQKSFVAHTRRPCRDGQRAASMPHTRI